ncbi:MAG: histone, partial [Alphaproteobacteria bacterium]|nr:histone [Alphaproteobacteria bacterium]
REEFEAVKAMAAKARAENTALGKRLALLEGAIQAGNAKRKSRAAPAATRKATAKGGTKPAAKAKKSKKTTKK